MEEGRLSPLVISAPQLLVDDFDESSFADDQTIKLVQIQHLLSHDRDSIHWGSCKEGRREKGGKRGEGGNISFLINCEKSVLKFDVRLFHITSKHDKRRHACHRKYRISSFKRPNPNFFFFSKTR